MSIRVSSRWRTPKFDSAEPNSTGESSPVAKRAGSQAAPAASSSSSSSTAVVHDAPSSLARALRRDLLLGRHRRAARGAGEAHEAAALAVEHAAEVAGDPDRPRQRHGGHLQRRLDVVDELQRLHARPVVLVDERDERDPAGARDLKELERLRLDAARGVEQDHGAVGGGEHAQRVLGEVAVAGGVEQVEDDVAMLEAQRRRADRDAAALLDLHPVRARLAAAAAGLDRAGLGDRAAVEQQLLGQRRLAGVRVGDDRERAASRRLGDDVFGAGRQAGPGACDGGLHGAIRLACAVARIPLGWHEALPRHDVRLPDERARLRADEGHARRARLRRGRGARGRRRDPLQHLLDPREGRHEVPRPPRPRQAPEARGSVADHRRRRLLGAVGQGRGLRALSLRRRRVRARPGAQARRVSHLRLAHRAGLLRVRGLHRPPAGQARPRVSGLGADLGRLQLEVLVLHRPVHARARGVAAGRRARRGGPRAGRRRRARGHAAGPERQLLRARPAPVAHLLRRAAGAHRRDRRHRAHPLHEPAPEGHARRTSSSPTPGWPRSASTSTCRCSRARRGC